MNPSSWRATYRLQLHPGFPLGAARERLPYLAQLGISHVYLSPCLQATPATTHGYDVTNPLHMSTELGGEEAWTEFCGTARGLGLGVLLDFVPNHMAAHPANAWWQDVLTHGPYSAYAGFFDLVFNAPTARWRVGLAVLPDSYQTILGENKFQVRDSDDGPRLILGGDSWPLNPASWPVFLPGKPAAEATENRFLELVALPSPDERERLEYLALREDMLARWRETPGAIRQQRATEIAVMPDRLHALLEQQYYSLHTWKRSNEVVNYRRFFDVNGLVGLRMERAEVFAVVHQRLRKAITAGEIEGVRVDHPDGLRDPADYNRRLRELLPAGRIYLEKILDSTEKLPTDWPVDGTTGYDFLAMVNRLWMDAEKADAMAGIYTEFTGHPLDLNRIVRDAKARIVDESFSGELDRLAELAARRARARWQTKDIGRRHLRQAIAAVSISLPIYRTYRSASPLAESERRAVQTAIVAARASVGTDARAALEYVEDLLLGTADDADANEFVARWQQLTPAIMAKGMEDTTFYRYDRLLSCNEVGAQPSLLGVATERFHEFCHHLSVHWPRTLLATSTHDSKRSEDVRTRISVISELPEEWRDAIADWSKLNQSAWAGRAPDRHAEFLLYQTLVGAYPLNVERAWAYLLKALREAKINTSWQRPNLEYETGIRAFLSTVLNHADFVTSLEAFATRLMGPGRVNSLAQTLIKLTAPGVPDFYQGSELWDLSLVDPDNRRPVDFDRRAAFLAGLHGVTVVPEHLDWEAGTPKLWLIARVLQLRREQPAWFDDTAGYLPVAAHGGRAAHLLGFQRGEQLFVIVPRFLARLQDDWQDTSVPLPAGRWRNYFDAAEYEGTAKPAELFKCFPVALLVRISP